MFFPSKIYSLQVFIPILNLMAFYLLGLCMSIAVYCDCHTEYCHGLVCACPLQYTVIALLSTVTDWFVRVHCSIL